jgi:aminoglycoside 6'-N-acetyltransferase
MGEERARLSDSDGAGSLVRIRGGRVLLRPFHTDELAPWLDARLAGADDPTVYPTGPPTPEVLMERIERSGELHAGALDLAVEVDGRLIGEIGTFSEPGRPPEPGLFFLSIALFYEDQRGHGLGTEASRVLCDWLFASAGAERIESSTAVSNAPMRRVFEKLGFVYAGQERRWDIDWARYVIERETWDSRDS